MIGLDTNVLVRLIVGDDLKQQATAERLIREAAENEEPCLICDPVLCETVWVLARRYGASRAEILSTLQKLLAREGVFVFEDAGAFRKALSLYGRGKADFSDLLIGARCASLGARATYTFDRGLARSEGFSILD